MENKRLGGRTVKGNSKAKEMSGQRREKVSGRKEGEGKIEDRKREVGKTGKVGKIGEVGKIGKIGKIGKVGKTDEGKRGGQRLGESKTGDGKTENGKFGAGKTVGRNGRDTKRTSPCPVYNSCGGCQLLHLPYETQLKQKQKMIEELLKDICPVKPIIGMKNPFHYRNKVHAVFGHDKKGNALSGVYKEGTHILVPIESCMIEDEKADEIIGTIRGMLRSFKILTYDENSGYGFFRHVLVKRGFTTGEIMVVLVTASPIFPSKNNFVKALREKHPEITTIIQNVNDRVTSMVLGDKEYLLYGKGYIEDELCGYKFRISSKSFYQVNPVQAEVLYKKAIALAGLTGKETVLDAYCGVGTIGMIASARAGKVIGVELNQDAVKDAVQNAKRNGVSNIQFYCNDAGRFMTSMAERGEKVDVVLMDPPRSGSTEEFISAVALARPEKVIYISCGPETLQRDLRSFKRKGYKSVEAWPVDMFGGTRHIEVVIQMTYCGDKKK